jgi:hypothetical protein
LCGFEILASNKLQQKQKMRDTLFVLPLSGCQNGDQTWIYKDNAQRIATPESTANDRLWVALDTIPNVHDKA